MKKELIDIINEATKGIRINPVSPKKKAAIMEYPIQEEKIYTGNEKGEFPNLPDLLPKSSYRSPPGPEPGRGEDDSKPDHSTRFY